MHNIVLGTSIFAFLKKREKKKVVSLLDITSISVIPECFVTFMTISVAQFSSKSVLMIFLTL